MKSRRSIHCYTQPFQLAIYVAVIYFFLLPPKLSSQSVYQINSRTLLKQNNIFFDVTQNDTVRVSTNDIIIEFKPNLFTTGKSKMLTMPGIQFIKEWNNSVCHYQLTSNSDFISTITSLLDVNEIEKVYFSYIFRMETPAIMSSAAQGSQNVTPNPYMLPIDEEESDYWELKRTSVSMGYNSPYAQDEDWEISAWSYTVGDPTIRVAVIDDGLVWDDPDFTPDNHLGHNFFNFDPDVTPINTPEYPNLGTATASIIAGRTSNEYGMYGVAGGYYSNGLNSDPVTLVIYKAMERYNVFGDMVTDVSISAVISSIYEAIEKGVRIINLGFWFDRQPQDPIADKLNYALSEASDKGILIFAPNGQTYQGIGPIAWPAIHNAVIAVGGTDREDHRAKYNNYWHLITPSGEQNELSLPAKDIEIRDIFQQWGSTTGITSWPTIPCALASGISALVLSANPCLSRAEVVEILHKSCEKIGNPADYDINGHSLNFGYGLLNAETAVKFAIGINTNLITGDITWNTDRNSGDIIINPGVTLTLNNMTLQMADEKGITVKVGGKLIVNNSVITTACNTKTNRWTGIKIEGNPSVWNANINLQGYAKIYNYSSIKNARTAVEIVYSDNMGLISGGMVQAINSSFLNNDLNFSFGEYGFRSGSSFNHCSFVFDQNYYGNVGVNQPMVYLWGNNGVQFMGCTFANNKTANNGIGIVSYGSSYSINALCESTIAPCPESSLIKPQFNNLAYGIHAYNTSNKIIINNSVFSSQRGVCLTNCNFADILNTQFNIPEYYLGGIMPYGAYVDQGTGYHIEKNTFTGQNSNTTGNIGLYLYNTGSTQNYVYRNTFSNLSRAAVSDGNNRSNTGNVGLCFKCNDFSTNGTDIDVIPTSGVPLSQYTGISRYQGIPSLNNPSSNKDTLAAANTFTISSNYNMRNYSGNTIVYYYHQYNNTGYKISPNPVYLINKYANIGTTYNRVNICKSWINTGGIIQQQLAQKSEAKTNAEAASIQLQNTVDGGSTENLTFEVLGSIPPEALELRDQLLLESPFLSDTVMKTAIDKENVLPNAMLRDVLVQNPQAAKSDEIMNKLDERWEPMPDYMKEEIEAGKEIIGGREQLEAAQAAWQQQEGLLFNQIVSAYLSDTLIPNANTGLKTFLQNENTTHALFVLADICLKQGDYSGASQAITTVQTTFSLTTEENELAIGYLSLLEVLASLATDNVSRYAVDSTHALPLFALYNSGKNNATAYARDILIASGFLTYEEPINNVADSLKSAMVVFPEIKQNKKGQNNSDQLSLSPNPATTYMVIGYMLPSKADNAFLFIRNMTGELVWSSKLTKVRDQLVADISTLTNGAYSVSLQSGNNQLATKQLIITK